RPGPGALLARLHHQRAQPPALPGAGRAVGHGGPQRLHPAALLTRPAGRDGGRPVLAVSPAAGGRARRPGRGRRGAPGRAGRGGGPRAGRAAWWCAGAGLAGWALMTLSYLPVLRLYRLSPLRAPGLPVIALLYAAMTVDSARRHRLGRGGEWKGRAVQGASRPP